MFVIKAKHRKTHESMYFGTIGNEIRMFETLEEASKFPFPTADAAAAAIGIFTETKTLDYEVVTIAEAA